MSSLVALPDEVLKLVMEHVPLTDRLGSCCLVSRRLHAAAVAATDRVCLVNSRCESGIEWLLHYGHHVTGLELVDCPHPVSQIPCPNLLQLRCVDCSMQLGPAPDGSPGVIHGCTNITDLELIWHGSLMLADANFNSLSSLVHLESLFVTALDPIDLSRGTLPCLTRLTSLRVGELAAVEVLAELGALTNLQELTFYANGEGNASRTTIGPSTVPGLEFPTSLTELVLATRIEARLLSLAPEGLLTLCVAGVVEGPAEGPGSFLSCIARLQHLTELNIEPFGRINWPPPGPAYSALTASSNLESLCLGASQPPVGVWSYVFPASHKLPHLTSLCLQEETYDVEWATPPPAWGAAELSNLVSCCPNLCEVYPEWYMQPGLHVSELHKLTGFTWLNVNYRAYDLEAFQESVKGIAAVTQLRELKVVVTGMQDGPVAGLLPFTSLTALTWLSCPGIRDTMRDVSGVYFVQEADWGAPVWVRLLQLCTAHEPQARDQLAQLLADPAAVALHRAVTLDQNTQLTMHRLRMVTQGDALDQQLQAMRDAAHQQAVLVAELRGQLASQQNVVADQAVQLVGLRGEVAAQQQAAVQQQQLMVQQQQQLQAQQQLVAQQAAQIAGLQGATAAQQQSAAQQQQLVAQQGAQIAGLQGQLQAMQSMLQGLLQRQ